MREVIAPERKVIDAEPSPALPRQLREVVCDDRVGLTCTRVNKPRGSGMPRSQRSFATRLPPETYVLRPFQYTPVHSGSKVQQRRLDFAWKAESEVSSSIGVSHTRVKPLR